MNKQRRNLISIMEHQTIPPRNNRTRYRPMAQQITRDEEGRTGRKNPKEEEIEDVDIVAQIKEKVMPVAFLVNVHAEREEIGPYYCVGYVHPLGCHPEDERREEEGHNAEKEGCFLSCSDDLGGLPGGGEGGDAG